MTSLQLLLDGVVDYAGLFPPASLDLRQTVGNYAVYLKGGSSQYLGRLVLPVSRLREFEDLADALLPRGNPVFPWYLSAILDGDLIANLEELIDFNLYHARNENAGAAIIDTVETKAASVGDIQRAMLVIPRTLTSYFEIPIETDPTDLITVIGNFRARAKVRTGGLTRDAIPDSSALARFLRICARERVLLKATAGLHHALTGERKLTNAEDSDSGIMYGFLNVLLATVFARFDHDERVIEEVLVDQSPSAFVFNDEGVEWRRHLLTNKQIELTRKQIFAAIGSCSFDEPITELSSMNLLERRS